jgi:hypothetical protein
LMAWKQMGPIMSYVIKFLIVLSGVAFANEGTSAANGRHILWGAGNDSCGTFEQQRARDTARFQIEIQWIAGYVSAGNGEWHATMSTKGIESDLLKGTDHAALEAWLANYCKANPLNNLSSAALALERALMERLVPTAGNR